MGQNHKKFHLPVDSESNSKEKIVNCVPCMIRLNSILSLRKTAGYTLEEYEEMQKEKKEEKEKKKNLKKNGDKLVNTVSKK